MKTRNSSIELLRILAMVMVIAYHIFFHCIKIQLTDPTSIAQLGNYWYCQPVFAKRLGILALISPMGQVGNAIFLIISGYFMAHKQSIDLGKISKKLLLQMGFSTLVLGFASIVLYRSECGKHLTLIDFNAFNWMSWYAGYYFLVMVLAQLFLNKLLARWDRKTYFMCTITLFALVQLSWSASLIDNIGVGQTLAIGVFFYMLGGYIKRFDPFRSVKTWVIPAVLIVLNLFVLANYYICTAAKIIAYNPDGGALFTPDIPLYVWPRQLIPILMSIALFELFRRITIPTNRIINFIAASTFMVYLLHDSKLFYALWSWENWVSLLHNALGQFAVRYIICTLASFAAGLVCYCLYVLASKVIAFSKPLILREPTK